MVVKEPRRYNPGVDRPSPPTSARTIRAWCLYDWANSAFVTTVVAAMYPPFFRSLAQAAGVASSTATAFWGYTSAAALLVVSLSAPLLGALADYTGSRKRLLCCFAGLGVCTTACFGLNGDDTWVLAAVLFVLASVGFAGANVFYEALLPGIVPANQLDEVSARGYAYGYLGGGILLTLNVAWVLKPELFGFASATTALHASFASVAVWWAAFTVPLLRHVPEPPADAPTSSMDPPIVAAFLRLRRTFSEISRHRQLFVFLLAFWCYNDGISTIFKMATAYGDEIGIGLPHLVTALVITQFVGFPSSLVFGRLAGLFGCKRVILLSLSLYMVISISGLFMTTPLHFYLLAICVGLVQGGSQALSRSLFASMVPRHKSAELFGFYSLSGKLAGILGPLVFGVVSQLLGSSRFGIVSLIVFFGTGALILLRVDETAGAAAARQAEIEHEATR